MLFTCLRLLLALGGDVAADCIHVQGKPVLEQLSCLCSQRHTMTSGDFVGEENDAKKIKVRKALIKPTVLCNNDELCPAGIIL